MAIDKGKAIEETLTSLKSSSSDILGAAVVSMDGLMIASYLPIKDIDPEGVGAMSAALMGLSKKAAEALLLGEFKETYIKSKKGTIHLYAITSVGVLAVLSRHDANIGMINLESRLAVRKIADILGG
jgi:predicted regulator of Ras-like GTPase activity (Roadblock/LC7/MglB family)